MTDDIAGTLAWIEGASHAELKAAWGNYCPDWVLPKKTSVQFLAMVMAWRAQKRAYGGHSPQIASLLNGKTEKRKPGDQILSGTVLRRTWHGDLYEVMVLDKGFAFDGETYGSLSEIARVVTGTRWSSPAFFGLRGKGKKAKVLKVAT